MPRSLSPDDADEIRLCPLPDHQSPPLPITVSAGEAQFARLVGALSTPDGHSSPGTLCAEYADLPQQVLATSPSGPLLVHIPADGCGHYLAPAVAVLAEIRSEAVLHSQG